MEGVSYGSMVDCGGSMVGGMMVLRLAACVSGCTTWVDVVVALPHGLMF